MIVSFSAPILWVALGGALGAALRYLGAGLAMRMMGPGFPWGTLAVNVIGSVLIGVLAALLLERAPSSGPSAWAAFAITGVLGGFTTFSAFSLDAITLLERGRVAAAGGYILGSVALSIAGLWLGLTLARRLSL